ncbi:SET domain-containing protein [Lentithecium fluviatile CBS 122367]|uniref:SET domain-containing protein n=1 Tax=Lentithecium fluviatile CBS 122367 TaxID=1168545 RepID=A0A6G1IW35_9PLEO|nr:SET domain-containing protein [Lentithecium fluviatile CBS 122367]
MASKALLVALLGVPAVSALANEDYCPWPTRPQYVLAKAPALCPEDTFDQILNADVYTERVWSYDPYCVSGPQRQYCVRTNKHFRASNGLSIIATPKAAEAASRTFEFARKEPFDSGTKHRYEVQDVPGKGKGLVAKRAIKKGSRIMLDSPRIIASSRLPFHVGPAEGLQLLSVAVERLPRADKELVTSLDKGLGGTGVDDVLKTNSFACQINDDGVEDSYLCLFPEVARINHACRPNAHARFIPKTLLMEIKALRDIKPGEEITISYGKVDMKHSDRQKLYKDGWGFTCTCELCTADAYGIKGSDLRRIQFGRLRDKLNSVTAETYDAQQIIAWEKQVFEIAEREGFETLIAEDLERIAYVHSGLGAIQEARTWAQKAKDSLVEWTIVEGGPDNELRRVEELLNELGA